MTHPPGHAQLELVPGIHHLHPADAALEAMLTGWEKCLVSAGRHSSPSLRNVISHVRQLISYTNTHPWEWQPRDVEEWTYHLACELKQAKSTIRNKQSSIRKFCDYVTSAHYGWQQTCLDMFGTHPVQICFPWNTAIHNNGSEGPAERRPLTRKESQLLFDYADEQVDKYANSGKKGALTVYRDSTYFKLLYAWGLRANEAAQLDLADLARNPENAQFAQYGALHVRYGKGANGSGPRRRTVLTVMGWAAEALQDYVENVRPLFKNSHCHPALFLTEVGTRLNPREPRARFLEFRDALGLDRQLTLHNLRHSYVTHLIEEGVDPEFVREQVGHLYRSTTGLYTHVSPDFRNTMMKKAVEILLPKGSNE